MNASLSTRVLKALAVKWVPRSVIRNCNSGGGAARASTIISAVTFGPATKSGKPQHCRVQLSTMTKMAIQALTTGNADQHWRSSSRACRQAASSGWRAAKVARRRSRSARHCAVRAALVTAAPPWNVPARPAPRHAAHPGRPAKRHPPVARCARTWRRASRSCASLRPKVRFSAASDPLAAAAG